MATRIYLVKTPSGTRYVEASTKGQAINHCVASDYSADPVNSTDLYNAIQSGAKVEKVAAPEKKPETSGENTAPVSTLSTASSPNQLPLPPIATPAPNTSNAPAPVAVTAPIVSGVAPFNPPPTAPGVNVNPVLAEQQRINPQAVQAAQPIIQRNQ